MLIFDSIGTILLITLIAEILRWKTGSVRKCFFGWNLQCGLTRGWSRTHAKFKMANYYHKELHLRYGRGPRSFSEEYSCVWKDLSISQTLHKAFLVVFLKFFIIIQKVSQLFLSSVLKEFFFFFCLKNTTNAILKLGVKSRLTFKQYVTIIYPRRKKNFKNLRGFWSA